MKKLVSFSLLMLVLSLAINGTLMAQGMDKPSQDQHHGFNHTGMRHQDGFGIPNLTDEQKAKIKDLRLSHMRNVQDLRNQLGELRARQRTLTTADNPDMKAVEANIDNITKLQNQLMKLQANHRQQVRALLTPEQRLAFDMHGMKKRDHDWMGKGCEGTSEDMHVEKHNQK